MSEFDKYVKMAKDLGMLNARMINADDICDVLQNKDDVQNRYGFVLIQ